MNYRHVFHAGNFADVLKHAILAQVITALKRKDTPFFALDTHAGLGAYDLGCDAARRTGEHQGGITRLVTAGSPPSALTPYLDAVRMANPQGGLAHYPGSPELARSLMRDQDRLALVELHPDDVTTLRRRFAGDRRVGVHHMDGYVAIKALLPPPERRGVVLIDPPFEVRDEHDRLLTAMERIRRRWTTGIVLAWYPIKGTEPTAGMLAALAAAGGPETLAVEMLLRPPVDPFRLNGCGVVVVNPPWGLGRALAEMLPWLVSALAPESGLARLIPLVGENGTAAPAETVFTG